MPGINVQAFPWIPFEAWWNEPIYGQGLNNIITRSELVRAVRTKDGGSHYDSELNSKEYVNMKAGAGWKLISDDGEKSDMELAHLLTIWSIGWEITVSLNGRERLQQPTQEDA